MILLLIIVVILMLGYFMFNIYHHDNSTFYKLTGYSYLDMLTSKKIRNMHKVVSDLETTGGKVLLDVQIPVKDGLKTISGILLHESGIYVMHFKQKTGWIYGREKDFEWTELFHQQKSSAFENPIHETKRLIYALQEQLPDMDEKIFQPVVVFSNDCSFQQIEIQSEHVEVLKLYELKKWAASLRGKVLSETDIQTLFASLEGTMVKKSTQAKKKKAVSA